MRADEPLERLRLQGRLGDLLRTCPQTTEEACTLLSTAVKLSRAEERPKLLVANLTRLATAHQYANRHEIAAPLFEEALELADDHGLSLMKSFAHQHYGKALVESGQLVAARQHLLEAGSLREAAGDPDLIASTKAALDGLAALED